MPDTARVLAFPRRRASMGPSLEEVQALVDSYVFSKSTGNTDNQERAVLSNPDALLMLVNRLRLRMNAEPVQVEARASRAFAYMTTASERVGFLDEREFFLGEMALLAGGATRLLGRRQETELWLDRAEASYRHILNSEPQLARTAYVRLALRYDMRRYEDVLELLPSVALTFSKLGMTAELVKCCFLEAMALKDLGRRDQAEACFDRITSGVEFQGESGWVGAALVHLGSLKSDRGDLSEALESYARARPLLEATNQATTLADLKFMVADTLRRAGRVAAALEAYRESIGDHADLGLATRTAYLRVVLAEVLLEAGRSREAEWELLAALPTIESEGMAAEGVLAIGLLRESVEQRKTDPIALSQLRQILQASR